MENNNDLAATLRGRQEEIGRLNMRIGQLEAALNAAGRGLPAPAAQQAGDEREAFEKAFYDMRLHWDDAKGNYSIERTALRWEGWLAARAAAQPAQPVQQAGDERAVRNIELVMARLIQIGNALSLRVTSELACEALVCAQSVAACLAAQPAQQPLIDFLANLDRSRAKYPNNARMFDGLLGELHELKRAYSGDGDVTAEALDVAVCAYRIATEGDAGGNEKLGAVPDSFAWGAAQQPLAVPEGLSDEQIRKIATDGVRAGSLSWLGFDLDASGRYTIPILSGCHYQLVRLVISALAQPAAPAQHPLAPHPALPAATEFVWERTDAFGKRTRDLSTNTGPHPDWKVTPIYTAEQVRNALAAAPAQAPTVPSKPEINFCEHMWELQPASASVEMMERCRFCREVRNIARAQVEGK